MNLKTTSGIVPDSKLTKAFTIGNAQSVLTEDNGIRHIEPSSFIEQYRQNDSGDSFEIVRRRGFGHFALNEQGPRTISVFVHRGDSPGEGGSNQRFFSNGLKRFEPLSRTRDRLFARLMDRAIVVSDGSLVDRRFLRRFHNDPIKCEDAFAHHFGRTYNWCGFQWEVIGWVGERYGPTLVWGLTRLQRNLI